MTLAEAIARRNEARLAWIDADQAFQADPSRENRVAYDAAHTAYSNAKEAWAKAYLAETP